MTSPAYSCIFSLNCISEQSRGNEWESCGLQLLLPLRMFITFCAEQLFLEISRTCAPQRIECPWPSELDPKMLLLLCKMPNASFLHHLLLQKPMTFVEGCKLLEKAGGSHCGGNFLTLWVAAEHIQVIWAKIHNTYVQKLAIDWGICIHTHCKLLYTYVRLNRHTG